MSIKVQAPDGSILGEFVSAQGAWKTYRDGEGIDRKVRNAKVVQFDEAGNVVAKAKTPKTPIISVTQEESTVATKTKKAAKAKTPRKTRTTNPDGARRCKKGLFTRYSQYVKAQTSTGAATRHAPDKVGSTLAGMALEDAYDYVAKELAAAKLFDSKAAAMADLQSKYAKRTRNEDGELVGKNAGMQRMNLGNRLRGVWKVHAPYVASQKKG